MLSPSVITEENEKCSLFPNEDWKWIINEHLVWVAVGTENKNSSENNILAMRYLPCGSGAVGGHDSLPSVTGDRLRRGDGATGGWRCRSSETSVLPAHVED